MTTNNRIPQTAHHAGLNDNSHQHSCFRCGGFLVSEYCFDLLETGDIDICTWRCLQCGDLVDSVILQNRNSHVQHRQGKRTKWSGKTKHTPMRLQPIHSWDRPLRSYS